MQEIGNNIKLNKTLVIRIGQSSLWFSFFKEKEADLSVESYEFKSSMSISANLKEAFSKLQLLDSKKENADILIDAPQIMIPIDLFSEDKKEALLNHALLGHENDAILSESLPLLSTTIVYPIHKILKGFIQENITQPHFYHVCSPIWKYLYRRSFTGQRMKLYAYFHDKKLNIFSFQKNRFNFTNSFDTNLAPDAAYFILNIWKQLGLDAKKDELHLLGEIPEPSELKKQLEMFIQNIYTININEEFNDSPLTTIEGLPLDMILHLQNN